MKWLQKLLGSAPISAPAPQEEDPDKIDSETIKLLEIKMRLALEELLAEWMAKPSWRHHPFAIFGMKAGDGNQKIFYFALADGGHKNVYDVYVTIRPGEFIDPGAFLVRTGINKSNIAEWLESPRRAWVFKLYEFSIEQIPIPNSSN